jgi:pSer/pThr/pTyr-binding forkhead associated (FHA) protein
MALWRRKKSEEPVSPSIVVASLAGREDLLPDFAHPLDGQDHVIGRHDSSSIQVVDEECSRQHVHIRYDAASDQYYAADMKSANGTTINGHRITREVRLEEGDVIEIGRSRLIFTRREFSDHKTALAHFRKYGEHGKGTLIR